MLIVASIMIIIFWACSPIFIKQMSLWYFCSLSHTKPLTQCSFLMGPPHCMWWVTPLFFFPFLCLSMWQTTLKTTFQMMGWEKRTYFQIRISNKKIVQKLYVELMFVIKSPAIAWNSLTLEIGICHRRYSSIYNESMYMKNSTQNQMGFSVT